NGPSVAITLIDPTPTISASPSSGIACASTGVSLTASAASGAAFSWLPVTGLSSASIATPVATPAVTTTYTVTSTIGACSATASIIVYAPAAFSVAALATDPVVCTGGSTTLTSSITDIANSDFNTITSVTPGSLWSSGTIIPHFYDTYGIND